MSLVNEWKELDNWFHLKDKWRNLHSLAVEGRNDFEPVCSESQSLVCLCKKVEKKAVFGELFP